MQTACVCDLISLRIWTEHHPAVQCDTFLKRQRSNSSRVSITGFCAKREQYFQNWVFLLSGCVAPTCAAGVDVVNFCRVYYHCNTCTTELPSTHGSVLPIRRFPIIAAFAFPAHLPFARSNLRKFSRLMETRRTKARFLNWPTSELHREKQARGGAM